MWICLNDAFLSIVDKDCKPNCLLVRARRKGDIERAFPGVKVKKTPGNDYLFRAEVSRSKIIEELSAQILSIDYDNFKDSVKEKDLKGAYGSVWGVMSRLQEIPPYSVRKRSKINSDLFGDDDPSFR